MKTGERFSPMGLITATQGPLPEPILLCPFLTADAKLLWALIWLYIERNARDAGSAYPPREWLQTHARLAASRIEAAIQELFDNEFLSFVDDGYVLTLNAWFTAYRDHLAQPDIHPSPLENYACQTSENR